MAQDTVIQAIGISKAYGDIVLFDHVDLSVLEGEKTALIAKNGEGKSTILKILLGLESSDTGEVIRKNDYRLGYLPQEPAFPEGANVLESVFSADLPVLGTVRGYEAALAGGNAQAIEQAMEAMDAQQAWDMEVKARQILTQLNITQYTSPVAQLSGGEKKRIALAQVVLSEPDIIILDEPTNHLDLEMIEWLEDYLSAARSTLLMVTHDRYFLDRVCTEILELDDSTVFRYHGNYRYFLQKRQERIQQFNTETAKAQNLLRKEEEWARRMPKARGTKSKYRMENYRQLKQRAQETKTDESIELNFVPHRMGKKIIHAHHLQKGFAGQALIRDFDYKFAPKEKIGIVGPNGCGKTTLLNLLTGELQPDSGEVDFGDTLRIGHYKQQGIQFDDNKRVLEIVRDIAEHVTLSNGKTMGAPQFLEYFLFPKKMHYNYVAKLSGGEKRRLYLMTVLMRNPNFLILDEPTNDLDILTLNVLEDYLMRYQGSVLIVSHDRYFMDKIVDKLFAFGPNGQVKEFPGNYTIFRQEKAKLFPAEANKKKKGPEALEKPKRKEKNFKFKHKKELEQTEKAIETLTAEKESIEQALNNQTTTVDELTEKSKRIQRVIDELDTLEMRWLELQELKEKDE